MKDKAAFLDEMRNELNAYLSNRERQDSMWWLAIEEFASNKYYEANKKEKETQT